MKDVFCWKNEGLKLWVFASSTSIKKHEWMNHFSREVVHEENNQHLAHSLVIARINGWGK